MRVIAVVCVSVLLASCSRGDEHRSVLGQAWHSAVQQKGLGSAQKTKAVPRAKTRAASRAKFKNGSCPPFNTQSLQTISENCRIELDDKLARAAELRAEGNTVEEIAVIMGISTDAASVLISTTGSLKLNNEHK